jgi:uncharacterized protein YraI
LLGLGVAAALGRSVPAAAQGGGTLQTTTVLNLRNGPSTAYDVLRVMPAGAHVFDHGDVRDGFRLVTYDNTRGWASDSYLTAGTSVPPHAGPVIGTAFTTVALNHRAGPSMGDPVARVLPQGAAVEATGTVVDGYRYVYYGGQGGWAADQYLSWGVPGDGPYDPAYATATANLNLRAGPSASDDVLRVIPSGATVRLDDGYANGYRRVTYGGTAGWAATAYLN